MPRARVTTQGWRPGLEAAGGPPRRGGWGRAAWSVGGLGVGGLGRGRHIAELTHEARVATQEVVDVRRAEVARQPHASGRVDLAEPRQPFVGREARRPGLIGSEEDAPLHPAVLLRDLLERSRLHRVVRAAEAQAPQANRVGRTTSAAWSRRLHFRVQFRLSWSRLVFCLSMKLTLWAGPVVLVTAVVMMSVSKH